MAELQEQVIDITDRLREIEDICSFIDAHGGKIAPFTGYGAANGSPA